ncbi:putative transposase [Rhodococcus sp. PML026]|nr:putative transposase [Rhodococcus sp. PML026]
MLGPLPRATRRWDHHQRLTQRDQLGDLRLSAHLRPGPFRIGAVELWPPSHRQIRYVTDIVHAQFVFRGQGVITRNDRDLPLGEQVLGVEPDEIIDAVREIAGSNGADGRRKLRPEGRYGRVKMRAHLGRTTIPGAPYSEVESKFKAFFYNGFRR